MSSKVYRAKYGYSKVTMVKNLGYVLRQKQNILAVYFIRGKALYSYSYNEYTEHYDVRGIEAKDYQDNTLVVMLANGDIYETDYASETVYKEFRNGTGYIFNKYGIPTIYIDIYNHDTDARDTIPTDFEVSQFARLWVK